MLGKMSWACVGMAHQTGSKTRPKEKHQSKTSLDLDTSIHEVSTFFCYVKELL